MPAKGSLTSFSGTNIVASCPKGISTSTGPQSFGPGACNAVMSGSAETGCTLLVLFVVLVFIGDEYRIVACFRPHSFRARGRMNETGPLWLGARFCK